ncbi:hypothetical protein [Flavobacterium sp.]|uniref:hypothetical protein n=1 Tax=Flavobacterium sp. TaxID=239 RepID=UPI0040341EC2
MKKFFALASVILILMTSCSGDDDASNNDTVLLKKIVVTSDDGFSNIFRYDYDGNRLTKITVGNEEETYLSINYTYSTDRLIKMERQEDGEVTTRTIFAYDTQGKLSSTTTSIFNAWENTTYIQRTEFTYNTNGTVSFELFSGMENNLELVSNGSYQFENGNIVAYTVFNSENTYTYDTKNSPTKNTFAIDVMNMELRQGGPNNILSYTGDGEPYTYTYTYNAANYPVKAEQNIGGSVYTTQYYYE